MNTRWIIVSLLSLMISATSVLVFSSSWGQRAELLLLDFWSEMRGPLEPPKEVVLVAMDESSYIDLNLPFAKAWPRSLHTELINKLSDYGATKIVFDILFLGESSPQSIDSDFSEVIKSVPTILGADSGISEVMTADGLIAIEEVMLPPQKLKSSAQAVGLVGFAEDDGYVRRFYRPRSKHTQGIPTLVEAAAELTNLDNRPGDKDLINYYGPRGTITTISYRDALQGKVRENTFKDKVVFIGLSLRTERGPAQKDSYITPYYKLGRMYGVEIHATAFANLIAEDWIKRFSNWFECAAIGLAALLVSFILFGVRPQWGGLIYLAFAVGWSLVSYFGFIYKIFIPGVTLAIFMLPIAYLSSTLFYYFFLQRSQRETERALRLYLTPEMTRQMKRNPESVKLGGESVWATAMFTDIADFTKTSEGMSAEEVARMLNCYFTETMGAISENQGTLIKYIGDAVFALWGAPLKISDHALSACQAAQKIRDNVENFNSSKRFPALPTRIGIHTGPMVVGNLGSDDRFDYTAIGDAVNLAARVEGLNKYLGTTILITDATQKAAGGSNDHIAMGSIKVAGKSEVVDLFTILPELPDQGVIDIWLNALGNFRTRLWGEALESFEEAKNQESSFQTAAQLYMDQIKRFAETPPELSWRGEIVFERK